MNQKILREIRTFRHYKRNMFHIYVFVKCTLNKYSSLTLKVIQLTEKRDFRVRVITMNELGT